jgi:hypothetical protein
MCPMWNQKVFTHAKCVSHHSLWFCYHYRTFTEIHCVSFKNFHLFWSSVYYTTMCKVSPDDKTTGLPEPGYIHNVTFQRTKLNLSVVNRVWNRHQIFWCCSTQMWSWSPEVEHSVPRLFKNDAISPVFSNQTA